MADLESLSDTPDTLREYETIYILRPDTANDQVADINNRVRGIVEKLGGKVLEVDNWGKRRLAYDIDRHQKGIYLYWQYLGSPATVAEFERNMRMFDSVIRYMTVKLDENVEPRARPSDVDEETFERAAATAAEEEETASGGEEGAGAEAADEGEGAGEESEEGGDAEGEAEGTEGDEGAEEEKE